MSQPVKLSDDLVMDARLTGAVMQRSIAGQVEFWAKLGKAVEHLTSGQHMERLQRQARLSVTDVLETVNTPQGHARLDTYLQDRLFPRFRAHPRLARVFIREDADGSKTSGTFHRGIFEPTNGKNSRRKAAA